jgi:type VI secretion system protein ImpI
MPLTFIIANRANLPDGGPMDFTIHGKRGADIGRDLHLDWSLPDPSRVVSSKHCEVRYREGGYWLTDVSTNGTFLNGSTFRMQGPHRLRNGDRLEIGQYNINIVIEGEEAFDNTPPPPPPLTNGDPWSGFRSEAPPQVISAAPPPPDPNAMPRGDVMDWYADIPAPDVAPKLPAAGQTWMRDLMAAPKPATPRAAAPDVPEMPPAAQMPVPPPASPVPPPPVPPMPVSPPPPQHDFGWGALPMPPKPDLEGPRPITMPPELMQALSAMQTSAPQVQPPPPPEPPALAAFAPPPQAPSPPARSQAQPFERAPRHAGAAAASDLTADHFIELIARGAGVSSDVFRQMPAERVAEIIGAMLAASIDELRGMLQMRAQAKGMVRSTNQTTIQAFENNPLKFTPTADEALRKMLGQQNRSYLPAVEAIQQAFGDLKSHQINTYSAMQQALKMVVDDLDPGTIERAAEVEGGIGGFMQNKKAKLWETYVTRWKAKTARHDNGFVDVFLVYFSEVYDSASRKMK